MSEKKAKAERAGEPKLTQEQRAAMECVQFIEMKLTGRPLDKVIAIIADTVVHLLMHAEMLSEQPKGMLVRAFGNLLINMSETMQAPADDAEIIDTPVVDAVETPEATEAHEEQ